jgi:hypothetical protein
MNVTSCITADKRRTGLISVIVVCLLITQVTVTIYASTKIKIATVPSEFTPYAGPGLPEPVHMSGYYFEVNDQMNTVRS